MNDYIKLPKDEITELENELYNFNSQIVSLRCIGMNGKITKMEMVVLNNLLGRTIKLLREIKDENKDYEEQGELNPDFPESEEDYDRVKNEKWELKVCWECSQMTNHKGNKCLKCNKIKEKK